jgi:DNA helicase II / ATP-dependent DNA helicase PcrA
MEPKPMMTMGPSSRASTSEAVIGNSICSIALAALYRQSNHPTPPGLDAHTVGGMPASGLLDLLDDEQRAAATHEGAPLLLVAGAGSGKTTTLAARLAWLVLRGADPPAAAAELLAPRRRRAGRARRGALHAGAGPAGERETAALPWCGTFHAVAARAAARGGAALGLAAGFTVLDRADAEELMAQQRLALGLARSATSACRWPPRPGHPLALREHRRGAGRGAGAALPVVPPADAPTTRPTPRARPPRRSSACSTPTPRPSSPSRRWTSTTCSPPGRWRSTTSTVGPRLRARFDQVLVDEVQDLNPLQWRLSSAAPGRPRPHAGGRRRPGHLRLPRR